MAEPERQMISDPKRLRALSHPLRWKLMDLIGRERTATATRCAEVLGESVASCSYHLNMLAKYDYIEEAAGGQGREKPWKLVTRFHSLSGDESSEEGQLAAEAAAEAYLDHEFSTIRNLMRRRSLEPEEWRHTATGLNGTNVYLTAQEAAELRQRIMEMTDQHDDRWDNPDLRPEGAREVRIFFSLLAAPEFPKK